MKGVIKIITSIHINENEHLYLSKCLTNYIENKTISMQKEGKMLSA